MRWFLLVILVICLGVLASCTVVTSLIPAIQSPPRESSVSLPHTMATAVPLPSVYNTYRCQKQLYTTNIAERFAARSAQVRMVDDNQVEIEMWIYRPERVAREQNEPIPTSPPDGYDRKYLPTDYEVEQYDLMANKFKRIVRPISSFRSDFCRGACEQQVLDESPDKAWQLIAVKYAQVVPFNGLWLVHKDHFQRLIAPFANNEFYPPSMIWWRWQHDSTGLFLTYRTAGEQSEDSLFVRLSVPPAYSFLREGVPRLLNGMVFGDSIAINDNTILLDMHGSIILDNGKQATHQWFLYESQTGMLRQAAARDFSVLAKYIFSGKDQALKLTAWNAEQQQKWLAAHPGVDIWNTLGDSALYTEPYRTQNGVIRIPMLKDTRKPLEMVDCTPFKP